jgi:4-diphosphocytidyl-2-C-methyl-D-erythritol kinase
VPALAKINLELRVLGKRPDGYHELRTIFQTISLADTIEVAFTPGRRTTISLADELNIPDNLASRAACLALEAMKIHGRVEMRLRKKIPMGAGLGGGSSDAAAVLLALPPLAGRVLATGRLLELAQQLGSDVAFFLLGGTAVGIGRGSELYPLPDGTPQRGILIAPGIHVSTAEAYRYLGSRLTSESEQNKIFSFLSQVWDQGTGKAPANDFEPVVFEQHRRIAAIKQKLIGAGASTALMTGSGSAVFGLFPSAGGVSRALAALGSERGFRISLVSRTRYRSLWWRALDKHITGRIWPPRSRYAR